MNNKAQQIVDSEENKSFWDINQQPFKELLTFVDFADDKLNIAFAEINFAQDRDAIVEKLIEHPNCKDIQFEVLDFCAPDLRFVRDELVKALQEIKITPDNKLVLLVTGLEKSIGILDEYPPVLVDLNYIRDDFRHSICHPIIFFLPEYALTRLAKYAPDFWAWGRKVSNFKSVESSLATTRDSTLYIENSISLVLPEKEARIDSLQRLLSEYKFEKVKNKCDLSIVANIYNELGIAYHSIDNYHRAIDYHQQSLKIAQKIKSRLSEANALMGLGKAYDSLGECQQAIDFFQQSLAIQRQISDLRGEGNCLMNLGYIYCFMNDYSKAKVYFENCLQVVKQIKEHNLESKCLIDFGNVYYNQGDYQQAKKLYQKSLEISKNTGDINSISNALVSLGIIYDILKEYTKAINCHKKALNIKEKIGDKSGISTCFNNLGAVYYCMEKYQQAIYFFSKIIRNKRRY